MREFDWGSDQDRAVFFEVANNPQAAFELYQFTTSNKLVNYGGKNHRFGPNLPFHIFKSNHHVYAVQNKPFSAGAYGQVYFSIDEHNQPHIFKQQIVQGVKLEKYSNGEVVEKPFNHIAMIRNEERVVKDMNLGESFWTSNNINFLVQPYQGVNLESYILTLKKQETHADQKPSNYFMILRLNLAMGVCKAVIDHYKMGCAHLDIKPKNIVVDVSDRVRLIDFGTTRSANAKLGEKIPGTPYFLMPLQDLKAFSHVKLSQLDLFAVLRTFNMSTNPLVVSGFGQQSLIHKRTAPAEDYQPLLTDEILSQFPSLQQHFQIHYKTSASGREYLDYREKLPSIELLCAEIHMARESLKATVQVKARDDLDNFAIEMAQELFNKVLSDVVVNNTLRDKEKQQVCKNMLKSDRDGSLSFVQRFLVVLKTLFRSNSDKNGPLRTAHLGDETLLARFELIAKFLGISNLDNGLFIFEERKMARLLARVDRQSKQYSVLDSVQTLFSFPQAEAGRESLAFSQRLMC